MDNTTTAPTIDIPGRGVDRITHPAWCDPSECVSDSESTIHSATRPMLMPTGPGWHGPIEAYANSVEDHDGGHREVPAVYFVAPGEGPLTPSEARQLADTLTGAADQAEGVQGSAAAFPLTVRVDARGLKVDELVTVLREAESAAAGAAGRIRTEEAGR